MVLGPTGAVGPGFVALEGSGVGITRIKGLVSLAGPRFVIFVNGSNVEIRNLSIEFDVPVGVFQLNTGGIGIAQQRQDISIRNVKIIGARTNTHTGVEVGFGAAIRFTNVKIEDVSMAIENVNQGIVELDGVVTDRRIFHRFGGTTIARNSVVGDLNIQGGTASLANTQVLGAKFGPGIKICVFSYDASFLPLGPGC